ncbi:hypothetical protein RclHR1_03920001 [Rhizophagus clarus]|jgi:hypothetical protein|uniref:Perilipin family-domain-containing protein n=1 Tax=Rhizophagus clarus TaxID=94130 RepID=A0A2Z6RVU8_9GLOM|nr:hypothetical protein RclHR1_03920001 [Rhizophagus clarus]GES88646.1 perilipin family-domain-containing protein [Rhizophagus clarus]
MSQANSNGTSSSESDSEHADFDIKSNGEDIKDNNNGLKSSAFIESLYAISTINNSIEMAKKYKVGRITFDLADAGANVVSNLAKPVSCKFSDQIEKADKIAAASVHQLSLQVPVVINNIKGPAFQTISTLGCTIEDNITTPGSRFVMEFDARLTPLVDVIEDFVQKYIPDEKGETDREIRDDQQQTVQTAQTLRVLQIALATRDRCVEKVKKQLSSTQSYTADQLRQLQESNQLLCRATDTVNALNQSLLGMVVNLRETVQNPDLTNTLQARLQNISTALLAITDDIGKCIKLSAQNSPEYLQERLKPLVTFFEERYCEVVNEIKNGKGSPIEKARNILQLTTEHTLPMLRSSLVDLQEAIHCYTNSLNASFSQFNNPSQILNVK